MIITNSYAKCIKFTLSVCLKNFIQKNFKISYKDFKIPIEAIQGINPKNTPPYRNTASLPK